MAKHFVENNKKMLTVFNERILYFLYQPPFLHLFVFRFKQ